MPEETPKTQFSLRLDRKLHRRIEAAAEAHGTSTNSEITWRLERSFLLDDATRPLETLVNDMRIVWARYREQFQARRISAETEAAIRAGDIELARALLDTGVREEVVPELHLAAGIASAFGTATTRLKQTAETTPDVAVGKKRKKTATPVEGGGA
jgi:hypothetical protein